MELTADVVVIGGGLAGACAALEAKALGADVLLVARAPGATALSSGAFDFAARGDETIAAAAAGLARDPAHPYALLGDALLPAIDSALALLRRALAPLGVEGARTAADKNLWLASPLGRAKPAALAQGPIAAGDLRALPAGARLGVVALAGAQLVEAGMVASGLAALLGPRAGAVPVFADLYRQQSDALLSLVELAADLDRPGRRAALAESLARAARAAGATHLLLPTLGLAAPGRAREELEAALGLPVFEALGAPPSVPGLRLQRAVATALQQAGVRQLAAAAERSLSAPLQLVRGAAIDQLAAGAVVLASGRFVGGGVRCELPAAPGAPAALRETVLDLPAWAAGRRRLAATGDEQLFAARAGGPHPGLAAGLRAGPGLRALDEREAPATAGGAPVFACGAVLGGFDPARGQGGLGVCAVTGAAAGAAAARAAGAGAGAAATGTSAPLRAAGAR